MDSNQPIEIYELKLYRPTGLILTEECSTMDSNQSEETYTVETELPVEDYQSRPYECEYCGNRFNRSAHLKSHLTVHTDERKYTCSRCGDKFKQSSSLKTHMYIHLEMRPYECNWCEKTFRTSSALKKHSYLHTGERPYACEVCDKTFTQLGALKIHRFTHKPESDRPVHCAECKRGFTSQSVYRVHLKRCGKEIVRRRRTFGPPPDKDVLVENGKKWFVCSVCTKKFKNHSMLRIHTRIHTGERPFKCELCERAFKQCNDLKVHLYVHTGERPHKCTLCDKGYTNKGTLNQHLRAHERERLREQLRNVQPSPVVRLARSKLKSTGANGKSKTGNKKTDVSNEKEICTPIESDVDRCFVDLGKKCDKDSSAIDEDDGEVEEGSLEHGECGDEVKDCKRDREPRSFGAVITKTELNSESDVVEDYALVGETVEIEYVIE